MFKFNDEVKQMQFSYFIKYLKKCNFDIFPFHIKFLKIKFETA